FHQTLDHEYYSFLNADSSVHGMFLALYWLERFLTAPQSHHLPYDHRSMAPTLQSPLLQEMQSPRLQIKPQYKKHLVDVSFLFSLLKQLIDCSVSTKRWQFKARFFMHPDIEGTTCQVFFRNKPPETTVSTLIAIIPHRKVMTFWHFHFPI